MMREFVRTSTSARPLLLAACAALLVLGGCTQRITVPRDKQACAGECAREQNGCVSGCDDDKGNPAVLEDIRGSLCEKRCKEGYENCMLACL